MAKTTLKAADIIPHKCGVVLSPPAVLYIYENKVTKKIRKLTMPVHNISVNSDIEFFAEDLKMRHKPLLDSVELETIKKMIFLLRQHKEGVNIKEALSKFNKMKSKKMEMNLKPPNEIYNTQDDSDIDDFAADTDFDDLDAPIDKLGIFSEDDDDAEKFWQ